MKRFGLLLSAIVINVALFAQNFTPGNLVVYRAGDGANPLINTGSPVFIDEYTIAGTLVQSVAMPTAAAGGNFPFSCSGTATSEGLISQSVDGKYLLLTGYSVMTYSSSLSGSTSAAVPRIVGVVNETGSINTSIALGDFSSGNSPRGVASTNGTDIWVTGGAGGVRYVTSATTSQQLSTTVTNIRGVSVVNGQLYISTSSGSTVRMGTVGTGTPTTSGQTITNLPGIPASTGSPYGFLFADMDAGTAGVDVLYVADDTPGTIIKYSLVAGSWVSNGTVTAAGIRGLTGFTYSNRVYLYGTTGASSGTGGGTIYALNDNAGYNAAISGTVSSITTLPASSQKAFRGIAFAPFTVVSVTDPSNQTVAAGAGTATFSVTASGTMPTYQWYENGAPIANGGMYAGATTATLTVTNAGAIMNGNTYYCVVSNGTGYFPAGSTATSNAATLTVTGGCIPTTTNNPQTICNGDSYTINGNNYTSAGTYHDTLTDISGCDSIIVTQLTVNPTYSINNPQTICAGDSYMFNGNTYTTAGTYHDTLTSMSGCDSIIVTQLTVNPVYSVNNPQQICGGSSYTINGHTYTMAGTYNDTLTSISGCDSVVITQITVVTNFTTNNPQAICQGDSYTFNGNTYSVAGTYNDTLSSVAGCDSIIVTQLTVNPIPSVSASNSGPACENGTINLNAVTTGVSYSWTGPNSFSSSLQNPTLTSVTPAMSGTYSILVTDVNSCQSQATTNVVVNPLPIATAGSNSPVCESGQIDLTSTGGILYAWAGPNGFTSTSQNPSIPNATLAMSGTYMVTVSDANGCANTTIAVVTVQTCVGLQQISTTGKQISIVPNPNNGIFTIQSDEELGAVEIYNGIGQLVLKQISKSRSLEINMSEQHAGIYYVKVAGRSLKVVKQ
jgi:hypothetical protein